MNIHNYLKQKKRRVDNYLKTYIDSREKQKESPGRLIDAMSYALMAGGKRVRPILAIAGFEAVGGSSSVILPVAASLELIHSYSLIHDDLPAMDDDDFRRNLPTTHRVFGEGTAILAGDALLTDAFHIISSSKASPEVLIRIINELSSACGPMGMVGGQIMDLLLEGKLARKKDLLYIHSHKTGSFIRAAVRIGALMGNAPRRELNALSEYGEKVGLAFQIIDDILDITGTQKELGKTTGADYARGKNTYPSTFGLKESHNKAEHLIRDAIKTVKIFNKKGEPLAEIARYILSRRN